MLNKTIKNKFNIELLFVIIPFLFGLFYDFAVFAVAISFLIIILLKIFKDKKIKIYFNCCFISIIILTLGYFFTCFWAVDKTDAIFGFFRILTVLLFVIILMQYDKDKIQSYSSVIPKSGIVMTIISIVIGFIPFLRQFLYSQNGRLTGLFQYSNTFALFLLIGLIIEIYSEENIKEKLIKELILLLGILLTGSRTVFLLTILFFTIYLFTSKSKNKWKISIGLFGIMIVTVIIAFVTNNFNTIGRYLTISLNSSTLWGRVIYYLDGIKLLKNNLFGYGYMGYSYIYPTVQTALYSVKFVHSDFLQIALDAGIIPMLTFAAAIIYSIFTKKTSPMQKVILIIMFLHMLIDIDLQFIVMYLILIAMQDLSKQKELEINIKKNILLIAGIVILIVVYGYLMIATFMNYIDKNDIAINMLPNYTEAKIELMRTSNDIMYANILANEIIENNMNISLAYNIKAQYELSKNNYEKMCEYQEKAISLNKYNPKAYEEYIVSLSKTLEKTVTNNSNEDTLKYMNKVIEIKEIINEVKKGTSPLANKIQDDSNIVLNEQTNKYIENIEGVIEDVKIRQEDY